MAMHAKLDELLRVSKDARNTLVGAERLSGSRIEDLERGPSAGATHDGGSG